MDTINIAGQFTRHGSIAGVHVALSLLAILAGFVAVFGMLAARPLPIWTAIFSRTTVLTSATGFILPAPHGFGPAHVLGILSLIALAFALHGLYRRRLSGAWRKTYVHHRGDLALLQFLRADRAVVPKSAGPQDARSDADRAAFCLAQGAALLLFGVPGFLAVRRFRPTPI